MNNKIKSKMENKKQSSVEWLVENMELNILWTAKAKETFEQAKAMHKEEIEDTFECGYSSGYRDNGKDGKQYYNETFGGSHE